MHRIILTLTAALTLLACDDGGTTTTSPTAEPPAKDDVRAANGKADTAALDAMCTDYGLEPGCDPCAAFDWYGDGHCDLFCPDQDSDCAAALERYDFNVLLGPGMGAELEVVYQATSDSFFCTDRVFDDGGFRTVGEETAQAIEPESCFDDDGTQVCAYTFPHLLGDDCDSKVRHIYLYPTDAAGSLEPWAALSFIDDPDYDGGVQRVSCTATGGQMSCGNDLYDFTPTGHAQIELRLDEE